MDLNRAGNFHVYKKKKRKKMSMMLTLQFLQITLLDTESDATIHAVFFFLKQRSDQINFYQTDFPSMQCLLNLSPELILNLSSLRAAARLFFKTISHQPELEHNCQLFKMELGWPHLHHKYKTWLEEIIWKPA